MFAKVVAHYSSVGVDGSPVRRSVASAVTGTPSKTYEVLKRSFLEMSSDGLCHLEALIRFDQEDKAHGEISEERWVKIFSGILFIASQQHLTRAC